MVKKSFISQTPQDWTKGTLGDICNYQNGTSLEKYFNGVNGYRVISIGNYTAEGKYADNNVFIDKSIKRIHKYVLRKNDLTMILNDKTPNGGILGRVLLISDDNKYIFNQRTMRLTPKNEKILPEFLYYLINSDLVHTSIVEKAKPGTQIYVNTDDITGLELIYPPNKLEQSLISQTFSDIDSLITSLQKLIDKKIMILKGIKRNLVTGKQKLFGYKNTWNEKKLGEITRKITTGKLDANAMKVDGEYRFYTCAKDYYYIDSYSFDEEALLVSGNGANVGYIHYYKGKFDAYQRTYVLTGFSQNVQYIKYYLNIKLAERIEEEVNAGNTPYIKMDTLGEMIIAYPNDLEEQNKIVEILMGMESEIEELQIELSKYKLIKQGVTHQLLTGKIRLI